MNFLSRLEKAINKNYLKDIEVLNTEIEVLEKEETSLIEEEKLGNYTVENNLINITNLQELLENQQAEIREKI